MHTVISIWRIIQLATPCLCAALPVWENGSFEAMLVNVLSVPGHIIPKEYRDEVSKPFIIVIACVFLLFAVFLLILGRYFILHAKLPSYMPNLIVIFCSTFGLLIHPLTFMLCGELLIRAINGTSRYDLSSAICCLVFQLLGYISFQYISTLLIGISVTFRPASLMTFSHQVQILITLIPSITSFCVGICCDTGKISTAIFLIIAIIAYGLCILTLFIGGGFINTNLENAYNTTCITSLLFLIAILVETLIGVHANKFQIIVYIVVWIIIFFVAKVIYNNQKLKSYAILDSIVDDENNFDYVKSVTVFMNVCVVGFGDAHPACINWQFPQLGVKKWSEDIRAWYTYAKFVAIYPEETYILMGIAHSIIQYNISGAFAKQTLEQISALLRMREWNLNATLKTKLTSTLKTVQSAKHKLRHVWDMAIQGNISEMEHAVDRAYQAIEECNAQFNHLLRQYPNNRFVTRSYSRFLYEVCADTQKFEQYDADTKLLQRGIMTHEDQAHELGLHAFPNLPALMNQKTGVQSLTNNSDDNMSQGSQCDNDTQTIEDVTNIAQTIDELVFPAFSVVIKVRPILAFIFVVVPIIFYLIYGNTVISTILDPLDYVYQMSMIRTYVMMLPTYLNRYILEKNKLMVANTSPGIGGYVDMFLQTEYIVNQANEGVINLNNIQDYKVGNAVLDQARAQLFQTKHTYTVYKDDDSQELKQMTVLAALTDMVGKSATVILTPQPQIANPSYSTVMNNVEMFVPLIENIIDEIVQYVNDQCKQMTRMLDYVFVGLSIAIFIIWFIIIAITIINVNKEKLEVYKCLTSLQKNVVSAIADKLKVIKKNKDESSIVGSESDFNKQEENMLKIFGTASDGSTTNKLFIYINVCSAIFAFAVLMVASGFYTQTLKTKTQAVIDEAPHISTLLGAYSYLSGALNNALTIFTFQGRGAPLDTLFLIMKQKKTTANDNFNSVRYGAEDLSTKPFDIFNNKLIEAQQKCKDDSTTVQCSTPDLIFFLVSYYFDCIIIPHDLGVTKTVSIVDCLTMWEITNTYLYVQFFRPVFLEIVDLIGDTVRKGVVTPTVIAIVLICVVIISEIILVLFNINQQSKLRMTLKLLQHCHPQVIHQSTRIMAVLSGNFGNQKLDQTTRSSDYYLEIIRNMPDAIVIISHGVIVQMNKSALRLFDVQELKDGMTVQQIVDPKNKDLTNVLAIVTEQTKPIQTTLTKEDGAIFSLEITVSIIRDDNVFVIRDTTQSKRYNTLIAEERMKSDMLLASILPPKLVGRVQAGEKDISFEVQSASVMFMDIVEFTPWCAASTAETVMSTLNRLFTEFDSLVNKSQTLTRVKCIGDCYMAAGGIFAEVNQPEVHAKESVQFCLDSITAVQTVNKEIGQNLRIRAGVNTGGPLVAGVIGTGKPTFEIIGPVINMAQQMEHHGIPMQVHISRSVYELIYGGSFNIKERGQIEVKNGTVITYLVTN